MPVCAVSCGSSSGSACSRSGAYLVVYLDGSVDFGWYAYTPDEAETRALDGDITVLSQTQLLGACCAAAGLMVIAAELGYRAGLHQK